MGNLVPPLIWAIDDGRIGIANQAIGLAEAVGPEVVVKRCRLRLPWSHLPPRLWPAPLAKAFTPDSDELAPPWPDLVVSAGRQGALTAIAIKAASGGRSFLAQIQDPRLGRRYFDLLVVPEHDPARGENVVLTKGAVHRVTPAKLAEAARIWGPRFAHLPRPLVAVLIGGRNRVFRFDLADLEALARDLASLARREGAGLLVTPSRRTGPEGEAALRRALADVPAFLWDGTGDNPYFAFLACADAIVATADSVSMVSEAASTGKPVYVAGLAGGSRKFAAFHEAMREAGITRPFAGRLEAWRYPPLDDTARAAAEIRRRLAAASPGGARRIA
jgi:mitochondrial fission protein ELM1